MSKIIMLLVAVLPIFSSDVFTESESEQRDATEPTRNNTTRMMAKKNIGFGDVNATIGGGVTASVGGGVNMTVSGDVNATSPTFNLTGDLNVIGQATISKSLGVGQGITTGTGGGAGNMTVNGSATYTGSVTAQGDVVAAGKSLDSHIHSDPQGGNTSPPL